MQKKWLLPEVWFTSAILGATLFASAILGFQFNFPGGDRAAFVGIHYLYPLLGIAVWGVVALIGQRKNLAKTFLVALPSYSIVLICHFNLKLWAPHINPMLWDELYWQTDTLLRPLVDACYILRQAIAPIIPLESNFYMVAFIAMFYVSFCFHAFRDPQKFRTLFLAALLFQGLGAIAYLIMPALGPFIYEQGVEPAQTLAQQSMLGAWHENVDGGADWIAANGATHLTVGLAAMPSLHTGGSFLFLLFAWRYARVLVPLYILLFAFISIDAVASRWHYLIDLPVGMLLAYCCAWLAERVDLRAGIEPNNSLTKAPNPLVQFVAWLRSIITRWRSETTTVRIARKLSVIPSSKPLGSKENT